MADEKLLDPVIVEVAKVKPLCFGTEYQSRMILDHVITGRDGVIQMNHGTVAPRANLGGATHEEDEIYYILKGHGTCILDNGSYKKEVPAVDNEVIFIPKGTFHALHNENSDEPLEILTFWKDYRYNDAYEERIKQWGKSFKTIDED